MTTSNSPREVLHEQAVKITAQLKNYQWLDTRKTEIIVGIVQDDKIIKVAFTKESIQNETSEALVELILKYMSGELG